MIEGHVISKACLSMGPDKGQPCDDVNISYPAQVGPTKMVPHHQEWQLILIKMNATWTKPTCQLSKSSHSSQSINDTQSIPGPLFIRSSKTTIRNFNAECEDKVVERRVRSESSHPKCRARDKRFVATNRRSWFDWSCYNSSPILNNWQTTWMVLFLSSLLLLGRESVLFQRNLGMLMHALVSMAEILAFQWKHCPPNESSLV